MGIRIAIVASTLMVSGCGSGSLTAEMASTPEYTDFISPAGNRFIATRSTEPGRFFISLPSILDENGIEAPETSLPSIDYFREGADAFVKTLGENCTVTRFEVLKSPTHSATYSCSQ